MKQYFLTFTLLICSAYVSAQINRIQSIITKLKDSNSKDVLVVAHRGDWRNAPENSLLAIRKAIEAGADIVEIDVQRTKDGHLVIMHDIRVDRTTNAKGFVSDFTLDSLKRMSLRNGLGRLTYHTIPTLEEAMLELKGKAMANLDKCYDFRIEAYRVLEKTGTSDHAIFKGNASALEVKRDFGDMLPKIFYVAIVSLDAAGADKMITDLQREIKPVAFELNFSHENPSIFARIPQLKVNGSRIWINSLWASLNAGHDDDLAESNVGQSYGWIVRTGANIIQTDRLPDLISFLQQNNLHP